MAGTSNQRLGALWVVFLCPLVGEGIRPVLQQADLSGRSELGVCIWGTSQIELFWLSAHTQPLHTRPNCRLKPVEKVIGWKQDAQVKWAALWSSSIILLEPREQYVN